MGSDEKLIPKGAIFDFVMLDIFFFLPLIVIIYWFI